MLQDIYDVKVLLKTSLSELIEMYSKKDLLCDKLLDKFDEYLILHDNIMVTSISYNKKGLLDIVLKDKDSVLLIWDKATLFKRVVNNDLKLYVGINLEKEMINFIKFNQSKFHSGPAVLCSKIRKKE